MEREVNESYTALDRKLRELVLLAFLGLSWMEYNKRTLKLLNEWRRELPNYVDWWAFRQGLYLSYRKWFSAFHNVFLESGKVRKNVDKLLESFGNFEPYALKNGRKLEIRSELSNAFSHHSQYERLKQELGCSKDEMEDIFGDWAKLPSKGGSYVEEEKPYESKGDLFVISTHQGCSNRCLPDQGKLVSKSLDAVYGLWTGIKKDGRNVYSLKAMMARVDQYGYHNFILTGFNCRHHLYPYEGEMPHKYKFSEAREAYKEEQKLKEMERKARKLSNLSLAYAKFDEEKSKAYSRKWERMRLKCRSYAKENGLEMKEYLLK